MPLDRLTRPLTGSTGNGHFRFQHIFLLGLVIVGLVGEVQAEATRTPVEKSLCCQGRLYGVFDLSGTWEGVSVHNPPFGTFGEPNMLYETTGISGRAVWTVNLTDQSVGDIQGNGGQEVVQTYTGTYIETWYESPNFTGACTVFPTTNCRVVNRYASYDVVFSIRWCLASEGFVFRSIVATDVTLVETDSGIDVPSKLVINEQAGEFCPSVTPTLSLATYDYQDNLMIWGFYPVTGGTHSAFQEPSQYDVREFRDGPRQDCGCENQGTNRPHFQIAKKIGPADVATLRGDVMFTLDSSLPLDLVDPPFRPLGEMSLLQQNVAVAERLPGETDIEWQSYLDTIKDGFIFMNTVPEYDAGLYTFSDVPLFQVLTVNQRPVVRPARYRLRLRGINVEEYVTGSDPLETTFTQFTTADAFNLQVGETANLTVSPIDAIPLKKALINELSELSPTRYLAIENQALLQVNAIESGSPTDAQLEGLNRAVLAERAARDGARFAEQHVAQLLTGLGEIAGFFIDEVLDSFGTGSKLKDKKDELAKIESGVDVSALAGDGWSDVPATDAEVKQAMEKYIKENFDLQISQIAEQIKAWFKVGLMELKNVLELAGMQSADTDLAIGLIEVTFETVMNTLISQGAGAVGSVAKAAVKLALQSAQDEVFDTLPNAYTDQTDHALSWGESQFESWGTSHPPTYSTNKGWVEDELLQMGIDSYASLSSAQFAMDISAGFNVAEDTLAIGEAIPLIKKAKWAAKIGKYISGVVAWRWPLRSTFWDVPERVEGGVAKAFGQLPGSVFPTVVSPPDQPQGAPPAGLGGIVPQRLENTLLALETETGLLVVAWQSDAIDVVLGSVDGAEPGDFMPLIGQATSDFDDLMALAASNRELFANGRQMQSALLQTGIALEEATGVAAGQQMVLLSRVVTRSYSGPGDPGYLRDRGRVVASLNRLLAISEGVRTGIGLFEDGVQFSTFDSAVVIGGVEPVSQATAGAEVTQMNEVFIISARIRNLGPEAVSGVEAELSLPLVSPLNIDSSVIQAPPGGALAANDGTVDSGADETVLSWQVTYTGPLDDAIRIPLEIVTRSTSVDDPGRYFGAFGLLRVSGDVFDPDDDGMPSAWESDNGLNPAMDDADSDAESDGVSNGEEFDRETNPQVADSDGDGIEDADEIAGTGGWITDPANADSDGDGEPDGTDGSPLDPTTTAPMVAPEPVVAVAPSLVALDAETPRAVVSISNVGTGALLWRVESDDDTLVVAGNPDAGVQAGSLLMVGVANGVDPAGLIGQSIEVRVTDAAGTVADSQVITVTFNDPGEEFFEDGFEE
ncbi:hypothetical protein [Elongatibacter sediminis]|uniref:DUF11 domain-containing protein n=1 Tax=Elongatibacter sediminis TaxID=3119006 RepID=A0AAW9R4Z2_9GAMM